MKVSKRMSLSFPSTYPSHTIEFVTPRCALLPIPNIPNAAVTETLQAKVAQQAAQTAPAKGAKA